MGAASGTVGRLVAAAVATAAVALGAAIGGPAAHAAGSAEEELAARYAPLFDVQQHPDACGGGEPYSPAPVEAVLGRDDVVLRAGDGSVITTAPTADDLVDADADAHLDFPGNALDPGCDYERWFDQTGAAATPTVYSRVASDPEHPDRIALQYWVFWVYNDWNDKHEGDWEMLQVVFDAPSAEAALSVAPTEVAVAQHEGSERRAWDRVAKDGDRPIVFPATGSHATYYSADHWFGKSAASGFGCDDTRGPSTRIDPAVVMLPDEPPGPGDPFAWMGFLGRWGEQQPSFNNGPTGPITKDQWDRPIVWLEEEGRDGSVSLPPLGTNVTDFFCVASEQGSLLFIRFLDEPWLVVAGIAVLVALIVVGVRRTLWSPDLPLPLVQRRRNGQIMRGAARVLVEHRRRILPISVLVLLGGLAAAAVQAIVLRLERFDHVAAVAGDGGAGATVALLAGALVSVPVAVIAHAATIRALGEIDRGDDRVDADDRAATDGTDAARGRHALRAGGAFTAVLVLTLLVPIVAIIAATVWCVASSAADAGRLRVRAAFRESRRLTKGHRLRVAVLVAIVAVITGFLGPFVGTLFLIVTDLSFGFVNLIAACFLAVLLPWSAAAFRLLHGDLVAAAAERNESADVLSTTDLGTHTAQ